MLRTIDTSQEQEDTLAWVLAEQQAVNPDEALADVDALFRALVADRLNQCLVQRVERKRGAAVVAVQEADEATIDAIAVTMTTAAAAKAAAAPVQAVGL